MEGQLVRAKFSPLTKVDRLKRTLEVQCGFMGSTQLVSQVKFIGMVLASPLLL